jgi:hypothetical protein
VAAGARERERAGTAAVCHPDRVMALGLTGVRLGMPGVRCTFANRLWELAGMSSSSGNRVLDEPLSSDEIAQDACAFSFPVLAGYRMYWPEHAALDGTWTPAAVKLA